MIFSDALTLDAKRRNADGYLAVRAKAARVGHYAYSGREVDPTNEHGLRDQQTVNVLRDATEVFDKRSLGSFVGKPITDDHPLESVNASNWRDHARGIVMGATQEGEYVGFDLAFLDAQTIAKIDAGKAELSNGYSCKLEFGDFTAADGTKCQARQTNIIGNHVALVDRGRAGPSCRVGDAATCDSLPSTILDTEKPVKTIVIDGLTVDVGNPDTAIATINTLIAARDTAKTEATDLCNQIAAKDTQIAELTTAKKALEDAKPTPADLRDAAKRYAQVVDKAKALGITVSDEMDEAAIMGAAVAAKMGDAAKGWTADQVAASFAVLTKDVKPADQRVVAIGQPVSVGDAAQREATALARANDHNAWRSAGQAAA